MQRAKKGVTMRNVQAYDLKKAVWKSVVNVSLSFTLTYLNRRDN